MAHGGGEELRQLAEAEEARKAAEEAANAPAETPAEEAAPAEEATAEQAEG